MKYNQQYLIKLFFNLTFFLFLMGVWLITEAQVPSSRELFKSSLFTPPNGFTHGVEGPAVDKSGTVYAVNFARQGTIDQVTPLGEGSIFIELPSGSIGNGIRFDSRGDMLIDSGRIWRIDTDGKITLLDSIGGPANGIEVSPDERELYVNAYRNA